MDRDRLRPDRRKEASEGEGDIRDRQARAGVAHDRAQDQLREDHPGHDRALHAEVLRPAVPNEGRRALHEALRGREGQQHDDAEESLRQAGVQDRDERRQPQQNGRTAEHPLRDDGRDRGVRQAPRPDPRLPQAEPDREDDGEKTGRRGDEAVAVLERHDSLHAREHPAERQRPVGDGETGSGAGDQTAGHDQDGRRARADDGVAVAPGIVGRHQARDGAVTVRDGVGAPASGRFCGR